MDKELEYMRGDDPDRPVVIDMKKLKNDFMSSSRLISLWAIMYARAPRENSNGVS